MKIEAKLTYKQAIGLKTVGLFVPGLDEAIKEYEEIEASLIEAVNKISFIAGHSLVHCAFEHKIKHLSALEEPFEKLFAIKNITKYFHEGEGTTNHSLLYEDLIGSFNRVKMLIKHKNTDIYHQYCEDYVAFIHNTSQRFKKMVVNDFDLVPADIQ